MSNVLFPDNHHQLPYSCLPPFFLQSIKTHLLSTHKSNSPLSFCISLLCIKKKILHCRKLNLLLWTLPDLCQEAVYQSQLLRASCFAKVPSWVFFTASGLFHGPQVRDFSSKLHISSKEMSVGKVWVFVKFFLGFLGCQCCTFISFCNNVLRVLVTLSSSWKNALIDAGTRFSTCRVERFGISTCSAFCLFLKDTFLFSNSLLPDLAVTKLISKSRKCLIISRCRQISF